MQLHDYLVENESVIVEVPAFNSLDAISSSEEGRLACTPHRVVYVLGNDVTDISFNGVNSIEYTGQSYPKRYLHWGIGESLVGLSLLVLGTLLTEFSTPVIGFGGLLLLIGIITLIMGLFLRRSILRVHTPNRSYKFTSKNSNLDEIGHTIRGYEMQNQ